MFLSILAYDSISDRKGSGMQRFLKQYSLPLCFFVVSIAYYSPPCWGGAGGRAFLFFYYFCFFPSTYASRSSISSAVRVLYLPPLRTIMRQAISKNMARSNTSSNVLPQTT